MDQEILNSYSKLNGLNVSRETFLDFENYISMIIEKNKKINIISQKTSSKKSIIERHIIDSAQIIDFVDFNYNTTTDLGSGGGMPGIVVAIILKNMKKSMNVHLYEKSYHKSRFLEEVSEKLNLNYCSVDIPANPTYYEFDLSSSKKDFNFNPSWDIFSMIKDELDSSEEDFSKNILPS